MPWFFLRKRLPEIRQMDATECGAACLAMILNYYGRKTSLVEVREACGVGRDGLSALTIANAARSYGLRVRALSLQKNDLRYVEMPAIVYWEFNHFLVVERWTPRFVDVVDPAFGRRRIEAEEFSQGFTGIVISMQPGTEFTSHRPQQRQLSLWMYLRYIFRLPGFILQILLASLLLQLFGLGMPLLMKLFMDQVLPEKLTDLMSILGLGILLIALAQGLIMLLRSSILIFLQARVDTHMLLGFFEHLLSLPYRFFQQRSSGDLLSRLSSNLSIRDVLTNQMISTLLDSGTVLVYTCILWQQSPGMTLLTLGIGALQVVLLLITTRPVHVLSSRDLVAQGKAQGYMAEALVGIATLKAAGSEHRALHHWSNLFFDHLNISVRRDYIAALYSTVVSMLNTFAPLILLWFGAFQVMNGSMSLGTMLALNTLAISCVTPLTSLANTGQRLQLVRAHFNRIVDVIEAEPEQKLDTVQQPPVLTGLIECKNLSFRYDQHGVNVLEDINVLIEPGKKVAIVGRSGSGKSTLGKLLLGLYEPGAGQILYNGLPLQELNYRSVRRQFGVVLQETALFSGSVRENITFSDPEIDMEQVIRASTLAGIHEDVIRMPMEYETLVSEGGSAISGGQRQRIAIARALATRPAIMLFDEATSHLDTKTESVVERNLNTLGCTRIVIAHRLSTIRDADLILVMERGKIVERGTHEALMAHNGLYTELVLSQLAQERDQR
ncbi:MAG TPA: peptidase domain-containing ABC transporter [Ktedonobacteraceae bacterium]|nr:peptidase domain-containing ABC transporter [Ktedonobacteraceae bacterium]